MRKGSAQRLVCTKTQASYELRRKQRIEDLANRDRLLRRINDPGGV